MSCDLFLFWLANRITTFWSHDSFEVRCCKRLKRLCRLNLYSIGRNPFCWKAIVWNHSCWGFDAWLSKQRQKDLVMQTIKMSRKKRWKIGLLRVRGNIFLQKYPKQKKSNLFQLPEVRYKILFFRKIFMRFSMSECFT